MASNINSTGFPVSTDDTFSSPAATDARLASQLAIKNYVDNNTFSWITVTGTSTSLLDNVGVICNNAGLVTCTLPSTFAVGAEFRVSWLGAGGWRIAQNAGQQIYIGSQVTTTGASGYLEALGQGANIHLVGLVANTTLTVVSAYGTITVV